MTEHAAALAACLPDDPNDHGPIGVPSDAVRGVLDAVTSAQHLIEGWDEFEPDPTHEDIDGMNAFIVVIEERVEALRTALGGGA